MYAAAIKRTHKVKCVCVVTCSRFRMHQFEGNFQTDLTATQTKTVESKCVHIVGQFTLIKTCFAVVISVTPVKTGSD